jgi:hypothetical protein
MANTPEDSIYGMQRTYFLNNLQWQVGGLKNQQKPLQPILASLSELLTMIPGSIEMADLLGDTRFVQICLDLQPLLTEGMRLLRANGDPHTRAFVAGQLESAVPISIRLAAAEAAAQDAERYAVCYAAQYP